MPLLDANDVATAASRLQPLVRARRSGSSALFDSTSGLGLLVGLLVLLLGCDRASLGLPREAFSAASPDGEFRAVVRNHPSIDPPRQSLWLESRDRALSRVRRLSEDQDWCDLAVWSPDSRRVVFLVQGIQAVVVDARSRRELLVTDLAPRRGYPPDKTVRDLGFAPAGDALSFRVCRRSSDDCGEPSLMRIHN